jgi:O-antigen ligase
MRAKAATVLASAAAISAPVSIAFSQLTLGASIASLLLNVRQMRWPPVTAPLVLFMVWTLVSVAASPDPAGGLPQVKKFFVYLMLFAVYSAVRSRAAIARVGAGWVLAATASAVYALWQYAQLYRGTPDLFYHVYSNGARITGFMDHWMTFSGITMMALLIVGAQILFERASAWRVVAGVILAVALLAGFQRTMQAGAVAGAMWLLWSRQRWMILLVPVAIAVLLAVNPLQIRARVFSIFQPQLNVSDSTAHRAGLRATGWEMIKAHPLVGVGPEQIQKHFLEYAPAQVPRPIPDSWYTGHLHNIYYQFGAERGLPALAAMLWFFARALRDFHRGLHAAKDPWMLHASIACTIAVMVAGLAEHNLGDSEPLAMFLSVVAVGYAALAQEIQPSAI